MLSSEIMGALALGVLWLNTGLVLAVALRRWSSLRALSRRLREARSRGGLVRGEVTEAPDGRFAVRRVKQLGRAVTSGGPKAMLFTDGPQSFEIFGGAVETSDGPIEVEATEPVQSEVWHDVARGQRAVEGTPEEFDEAYPVASKYKGFERRVEVEIGVGDEVWVLGERDGDTLRAPDEAHPLVVSTVDMEAWASSRTRLIAGFVFLSIVVLCGVTALAVTPPVFGLVSTIGGALGLAYFLAIQPLGTALRDKVKTPARALLNGEWRRDG